MTFSNRFRFNSWVLTLLCASTFLCYTDYFRIKRVEFVSKSGAESPKADAQSPTGYAMAKRWLVIPEHDNPSYQAIEETQLMVQRGSWRMRSIGYENSPFGRVLFTASPNRWWLLLVAETLKIFTGLPLASAIERAALYSGPLLHLSFLLSATIFVAFNFGSYAACLVSLGLVAIYPLGASFLPGIANDYGMSLICAFWSVMLLLPGRYSRLHNFRRWFLAGAVGGIGLWIDASRELPVILGIALGASSIILTSRRIDGSQRSPELRQMPWMTWALGGSISCIASYLIENFPDSFGFQLRVNHPLYAIAWITLAVLLTEMSNWISSDSFRWRPRSLFLVTGSALILIAVPLSYYLSERGSPITDDLLSERLTSLPNGIVAQNLWDWVRRGGLSWILTATCLPLALISAVLWILFSPKAPLALRAGVSLAIGPLLIGGSIALFRLRWWNEFDCILLVLLATLANWADQSSLYKSAITAIFGMCAVIGVSQLLPGPDPATSSEFRFTRAEVESLYERSLAHWIADHAGPNGATVLAPPYRTSSFCFYGSLSGIGTQNWENPEGLSTTFRIITSTRPDESQALIKESAITHIVVPSWDTDFDNFSKLGLTQPKESFIYALHETDGGIFNWLRAIPYNLPSVGGFEDQSVLILEVTDPTDAATLRSRLVEYLIEMHQAEQAAYAAKALRKYPTDIGALAALAQAQMSVGDHAGFNRTVGSMLSNLSTGQNRPIAWDRRVSLAVALALGKKHQPASDQVKRCIAEANADKIRFLTTGSLYHLLVLSKAYGISISDPGLRHLAMDLLPPELRERL